MVDISSTAVITACVCLIPVFSQQIKNHDAVQTELNLRQLTDELKALREEMRNEFASQKRCCQSLKKRAGPGKKKHQQMEKKLDTCTAGVQQLQSRLLATTTPAPTTIPATMTVCASGWYRFEEHCYLFSSEAKPWSGARKACMDQGGQLVSINSQSEQDFLKRHKRNVEDSFWIGLTWIPNKLQWLDGSDVTFAFWSEYHPDCMIPGGCRAALAGSSPDFRWADYTPNTVRNYICENDTVTVPYGPTTTIQPTRSYCQPGSIEFQAHCYYFEMEKMSWLEASTVCEGLDSYLVSINSQAERNWTVEYIKKIFNMRIAISWYGLTYDSELKKMKWLDGSDFTFSDLGVDPECIAQPDCKESVSSHILSQFGNSGSIGERYFICEYSL